MSTDILVQVNEIRAFMKGMEIGLTINPGLDPEDFMGLQNESTLFKKAKAALDVVSEEVLSCKR